MTADLAAVRIDPHQPHTGGSLIDSYPWHLALDEIDGMVGTGDEDYDDED